MRAPKAANDTKLRGPKQKCAFDKRRALSSVSFGAAFQRPVLHFHI
jgi:hypothetical protein